MASLKESSETGLGLGKVLDEINVPYKEYVPNIKDYEQLTINCAI